MTCEEGAFDVIVGPSGCGKSTTLRMIAGLVAVSSGSVFIAGMDVTWAAPKERNIARVFQSYALYPHMNVVGNMTFALRLAGRPRDEVNRRVHEAAELLELLELAEYLDRRRETFPATNGSMSRSGRRLSGMPTVSCSTNPFPIWTRNSGRRCARNWQFCTRNLTGP